MAAVTSVAIKAATSGTDQEQSATTSSDDEEDYRYGLSSSSRSDTGVPEQVALFLRHRVARVKIKD